MTSAASAEGASLREMLARAPTAIAPARTSRGPPSGELDDRRRRSARRGAGVEHARPGVRRARRSTRRRTCRRARPTRLALVAVIGKPSAGGQRARHRMAGTRIATVPSAAAHRRRQHAGGRDDDRERPGPERRRPAAARARRTPPPRRAWSSVAAISGIAHARGRALHPNSRSTRRRLPRIHRQAVDACRWETRRPRRRASTRRRACPSRVAIRSHARRVTPSDVLRPSRARGSAAAASRPSAARPRPPSSDERDARRAGTRARMLVAPRKPLTIGLSASPTSEAVVSKPKPAPRADGRDHRAGRGVGRGRRRCQSPGRRSACAATSSPVPPPRDVGERADRAAAGAAAGDHRPAPRRAAAAMPQT